jgi:hypothetical protein
MIAAIALMSLSAMTLTLLGTTIFNQSRRTQILSEDAQLRQLLIAGATFAQSHVQQNSTGDFPIPLPETSESPSAQLTVRINRISISQFAADIEASIPHHRLTQHLIFTRESDVWQISQAQLGL